MMLLKAVETNRAIIGPGEWERRSWKIQPDGTYRLKTTYHPVDPGDPPPEVIEEGALYDEQLELLKVNAEKYWHDERTDASDGTAWEFKLYDDKGAVIRHREPGYIYGIEPFESIAAMLLEELPKE